MGHGTRRWLAGLGAAATVGASLLGQAGAAGAASTGPSGLGGHSGQAGREVAAGGIQPGSVYVPASQILVFGDHGPAVRALQQRLNFLHYYPGKIDGHFGWDTMEAVWAFKEVQSGKRIPVRPDIVGPAMQRELARPRLPKVLKPHGGRSRIEINKRIGVLVVYRSSKVALISHVSTAAYYRPDGSGWVTPDGTYRAWEYLLGCVPDASFGGCLYNPVFFIGTAFAIHGMPNPTTTISGNGVPLNPASHGCVRIPLDISQFLHKLIHVSPTHGTPIYISGPNYYGNGAFQ